MSIPKMIRFASMLMAVLLLPALYAQFEAGTVVGTIHDPSGAVVVGCKVVLENVGTGVTVETRSDSNGNYEFVNQHLGAYRVRAEMSGFQNMATETFQVTVNARQRVDLTLQVGQATQNVTVTGAAALLETDSSSRGQLINQAAMHELPLNGRAYADLTLLSPGVAKSPLENSQSDSSRDASFNVNGGRSEQNNFLLDGIDNNAYGTSNQGFSNQVIQANPDALAEFKVETNNYSAEFGRASGAVINATIKSGTNQFHGELWEFIRNTKLNAQGFFKPVGGGSLPFNQNQFGAAAGGPIIKNKMFIFADYEGFRRVYHPVQFATLPTPAMDNGDFSGFGVPIGNPLTGTLYPNGIIPKSDFSKLGARFWQAFRPPISPETPIISSPRRRIPSAMTRAISASTTSWAAVSHFSRAIASPIRASSVPIRFPTRSVRRTTTATFTPATNRRPWASPGPSTRLRSSNSAPAAAYTVAGKTPPSLGLNTPDFYIPNQPTDASLVGGLFTVGLNGGLTALGRSSSNPQFQYPFVGNPKVVFTKIVGRHSVKTGFEYQFIDTAVSDFHPQYGNENFAGSFSDPAYFTNPSALNSLSGLRSRRTPSRISFSALPATTNWPITPWPTCGSACTSPTCRTISG